MRLIKWMGFGISLALSSLVAVESALAQEAQSSHLLLFSDKRIITAKLLGSPIEGRWIAVQTTLAHRLGNRSNSQIRISSEEVSSIDCQNFGFESIMTLFNLETDLEKPPRWGSHTDPKYKNGFKHQTIEHKPIGVWVAQKHSEMIRNLSKEDATLIRIPGTGLPTEAELAVAYGCAVVRNGSTENAAAEMISSTLGLNNATSLEKETRRNMIGSCASTKRLVP